MTENVQKFMRVQIGEQLNTDWFLFVCFLLALQIFQPVCFCAPNDAGLNVFILQFI